MPGSYHTNAPKANSIVPAATIVRNAEGKILLEQRSDNGRWELPSGVIEIGESISETIVREVKEETGLDIRVDYLVLSHLHEQLSASQPWENILLTIEREVKQVEPRAEEKQANA
jgi:8-oxo-dGTP pyrophosphatase MutT (NUDIX family)